MYTVRKEMVAVLIIRTATMIAVLIMSSSHEECDQKNKSEHEIEVFYVRIASHGEDCDSQS